MNQKFGGGRQPTGTPSLAWSCVVVIVSLLAGASVVHNIYKPDLVILSLFVTTLLIPLSFYSHVYCKEWHDWVALNLFDEMSERTRRLRLNAFLRISFCNVFEQLSGFDHSEFGVLFTWLSLYAFR